jgi:predicted Fe-Mo cluster-binding NifX family protein
VHSHDAEAIVTGGMGRRAVALFEELGVQAFSGAVGTVQEAVTSALAGGLGQAEPCAGRGGGDCDEHDEHQHIQ